MKIFPLKPMSNYDRMKNIYNIIVNKVQVKKQTLSTDVAALRDDKSLKKGRIICDMLSE